MISDVSKYYSIALWCAGSFFVGAILRIGSGRKAIYSSRSRDQKTIEICLSDIESLKNAIDGGCSSVELCVDRSSGGVTPSYGLVKEACSRRWSNCEVHVLIRPRDGNFNYSCDEFDVILDDIIAARHAGADGAYILLTHPPA